MGPRSHSGPRQIKYVIFLTMLKLCVKSLDQGLKTASFDIIGHQNL
jgi:hypothetical protein